MKILLYLFVLAAFIAMSEALMCWSCNASLPQCHDFDKSHSGIQQTMCRHGFVCCYKRTWKLSNGTSVTERDCTTRYDEEDTHILDDRTFYCRDKHFCNGVSSTEAAFTTLMVLIVPLIYKN